MTLSRLLWSIAIVATGAAAGAFVAHLLLMRREARSHFSPVEGQPAGRGVPAGPSEEGER